MKVEKQESPAAGRTGEEEACSVSLPNDHGGYTPVLIKRSGSGFTGPQGEFYQQFPKVSHLQVMSGH